MKVSSCDELGANLFEAGRQWGCCLDPQTAKHLFETVESRGGKDTLERLLEYALDLEEVWSEAQRHAYKMALGTTFNKRRQEKREALGIPFAPR